MSKAYGGFISSAYAVNEINDHNMSLQEILELPLPLYQDYIEYQAREKRKQINKQKQDLERQSKMS